MPFAFTLTLKREKKRKINETDEWKKLREKMRKKRGNTFGGSETVRNCSPQCENVNFCCQNWVLCENWVEKNSHKCFTLPASFFLPQNIFFHSKLYLLESGFCSQFVVWSSSSSRENTLKLINDTFHSRQETYLTGCSICRAKQSGKKWTNAIYGNFGKFQTNRL